MNPTFSLTVDTDKRKVKADGIVAVGEKVDVIVSGIDANEIPEWEENNDEGFSGPSLRFRLVAPDGRDFVRFPLAEGDAWTVNEDGTLTAEVDFNTMQLRRWLHGFGIDDKAEVGIILDSLVDAMEYARGTVKVFQWAASPADDPTVLPDWRKTLRELNAAIVTLKSDLDTVEQAKTDAQAAVTDAQNYASDAEQSAAAALQNAGIAQGAKSDAVTAKGAAEIAQGKAEEAQGLAEAAQTAAEAAQTAAEAAAQEAEETLASKADKTALEAEVSRATIAESELTAEVNLAKDSISAHSDAIDQLDEDKADKTALAALEDAIAAEAQTREERDAAICANLNLEIGNRTAADQALATRVTTNETAIADRYTKSEVDTKIAQVQSFTKYLVDALPDVDKADMKGLYLVPTGETTEEGDLCDEYTVVETNGERRWEKIGGGTAVDVTLDDAVTRTSAKGVKSSGIWSAIWGALSALPTGFSSLYDWCVAQLAGKLSTSGGTMTGAIEFRHWSVADGDSQGFLIQQSSVEEFKFGGVSETDNDVMRRKDVSGKADAADLRYRIAEAGYATTGARLPEGVTVWTYVNGSKGEDVTSGCQIVAEVVGDYNFVLYYGDESVIARWMGGGDNGNYEDDLELLGYCLCGSDGNVLRNPPNLLFPRVLADRTVNLITATDETSIDIELPEAVTVDGVRYCRDFFLDVDNSANASDLALEFTGLGVDYGFVTDADDDIGEMMTIAGYGTGSSGDGARARLYFTECAVEGGSGQVLFHVARVTLSADIDSTTQGGNS